MFTISKRWTTGLLGLLLGLASWSSAAARAGEHGRHDGHEGKGHGHATAHGGCLNVIEECAVGHVEVICEGDTLKVWFVGGDGATTTAVRVATGEIPLLVAPADGGVVRPLTLVAAPMVLAEETVGACSHFTATAPWLGAAEGFVAVGLLKFKGALRVLRIDHPEGFDPDHEDGDHDDEHGN